MFSVAAAVFLGASALALAPSAVASPASFAGAGVTPAEDFYFHGSLSSKCGLFNSGLSCHNTTAIKDSCCDEYPGGHLLSTQVWFYDPNVGPADVWTLHGLWPDNCDGTYSSSCDPSRNIFNVTAIMKEYKEYELLEYMQKYWLNNTGPAELLWEHEWNKHGTCINTLKPSCFPHFKSGEDVLAYIKRIVSLYQGLPTYKILAAHDIVPTTHRNYTLDQIQGALRHATGFNATIVCDVTHHFTEVYYHYNIYGSLIDGKFVPTASDGGASSCPTTGIQYVPKGTPGTNQSCVLGVC